MFNKVAEYHRNEWPTIGRNMYIQRLNFVRHTL